MRQWYSSDLDTPIRIVDQHAPQVAAVMRSNWTAVPLIVDGQLANQLTLEQVGAYVWLAQRQQMCQVLTTRRLAEHLAEQGAPPEPHEPPRRPDNGGAGQIVQALEALGVLRAEPDQQHRLDELANHERQFEADAGRRAAERQRLAERVAKPVRPSASETEPVVQHEPDENGQWSGPWPMRRDTRHPGRGQNIVYLLRAANDLVVYVGSTNHFTARMKAHRSAGKRWTSWTAQACDTRDEAYDVENEFLQTYMPHLNVAGPRPPETSA